MLEVKDLSVSYGGLSALSGVDIVVNQGDFASIVGPNGAGKTTLFKAISGVVPVTSGSITFMGRDILKVPAFERPHLGIAHVPEGRQVFPSLTVLENLEMGALTEAGKRDWASNKEYIFSLFPILQERSGQLAGTLSGGQQQMLAIARAIASSPSLIMLDEPSMGLAPAVADVIFEQVVDLHGKRGMTVLLVEQRAVEALQHCNHGYLLETGRIVLGGDKNMLLASSRVQAAYLGM